MIDKERKMKYDKRDVINSLNKIGLKNDIIFTQSNIALFVFLNLHKLFF